MKNHTRVLVCTVAIVMLLAGCAEESQRPSVASAMSNDELAATIIELFDEPDRLDRTEELVDILQGVSEGQGEALGRALDGLDKTNRELDQVLIVAGWSKVDPEAATRWVIRNARQELVRFGMLNESVYRWALEDPEAIVRDAEMAAYSHMGWDATSLRALVKGWYESGQPNLEDFIYNLPPRGEDRQRAVSALIEAKLAHEGIEPVIEWATASIRGEVPFKQYIYSRLAGDIAKIDPERAVSWCEEVCGTKLGEEIPLWIATSWVLDDGPAAMDWITARDASVVSVRVGARAAYRRFLLNQQMAALEWMESTSEEARTEREAMQGPLYMYINERSGLGNPEMAIEWTKYLTSEREREEILTTIARRWLRNDPEAAEAWLADAPLSEDAKMAAHQPKLTPTKGSGAKFRVKEHILE